MAQSEISIFSFLSFFLFNLLNLELPSTRAMNIFGTAELNTLFYVCTDTNQSLLLKFFFF